jgi:hypothetical protein
MILCKSIYSLLRNNVQFKTGEEHVEISEKVLKLTMRYTETQIKEQKP